MKRVKRTALAALLVLALAVTSACGGTGQTSPAAEEPAFESESASASSSGASSGEEETAGQATADTAITLTDQAGREVRLEAPAERIVSGYYISSSACIALGLADRLAGVEAKADTRPIYTMAAPQLLALPNVGSAREFNLEGCIALEPDLVILPVRLEDSANTLNDMGIPVLLVNPESLRELKEMISLIGMATGTDDAAARLLRYYEDELEAVGTLTARVTEKPRVYMGSNSSFLSTAPGGMYQSALIESAGGINAAAELDGNTWTEVSYEQLIALEPDVIVLPSEAAYSREDVASDPQLAALPAVQNGAIYRMPRDFEAWDSPTVSCMLGIRWLLSALHEDLYAQQALEEDAAAFYRNFYNTQIDTALIGK